MRRISVIVAGLAAGLVSAASEGAGVDPLTARVDDSAAKRFAAMWRSAGGKPTTAQIQAEYLANGGRAIEVFTPGRIGSAERLAEKIAQNAQLYHNVVERCLPWIEATNAQLRAIYLGLKGLFPDRPLPQIPVVIGANNSGGTAAEGIQAIGLEVICRLSPARADVEERMRQFFAHETVHTFQTNIGAAALKAPLVASALGEGVPDYVTTLVTARVPNPERDSWARPREQWIWQQFQADAAIAKAGINSAGDMHPAARGAFRRWFANAGDAPHGWPDELGYWVGMRIAEAYVAAAPDPRRALDDLLKPADPAATLEKSGCGANFSREE